MSVTYVKTNSATLAAATPAEGIFVWASDSKKFYRGNGIQLGGCPIGPVTTVDTKFLSRQLFSRG